MFYRNLLATAALITSCGAFSCTVDTTPYQQYAEEAEIIFLGAVVEIHWAEFEGQYKESIKNAAPGEPSGLITYPSPYIYRAVPSTIYKGSASVPSKIFGGYCGGALVDGTEEYLIMLFKTNSGYEGVAYSAHSPAFQEITNFIRARYVSH